MSNETKPPDICHLDASDVEVKKIEPMLCQSDACQEYATHEVWIDFRNAGQKQSIGQFCQVCANGFSFKIQQSLPLPPAPAKKDDVPF
jgi:hypothetical protein